MAGDNMFELHDSLREFKSNFTKYIAFALLYMLLTSLFFVPLISLIFNRMLRMIGTGSLLNGEVYQIGLSYTGLLGMICISLIAVVMLFIEFGVFITIAQKGYFGKSILISEAFVTTIKKLPKLIGFGVFAMVFILLLTMPFFDLSPVKALIDFNLPIFLTNLFYDSFVSILIYIALLFVAVYLFIRLIFTLHYIFIKHQYIIQAMKSSWKLTKRKKPSIISTLLLVNVIMYLLGFLLITVVSYVTSLLETSIIADVIQNYLVTVTSYVTLVFSLFTLPINIIIITRLFYRLNKNSLTDELLVQRNEKLNGVERGITNFFAKRKYSLVITVFIYITVMFFVNFFVNDNIVYLKWDISVTSHRGDLQSAPENSISSIRAAIDKGVDTIEIDVQMTKDKVIVLNHDINLRRTADVRSKISEMTYEEVLKLDIGRLFSDEFIGEKIPTLDQVMEEIKQTDIQLLIDVKSVDTNEDFAEELVKIIEKHNMVEATYVQSFNYEDIKDIKQLNSDIKIGQIMYLSAGDLEDLDVDFYAIKQTMLTQRFVNNAKKLDREVWVWTVNNKRNIREVLKYDIDGIITDYPERVYQVLGVEFSE
ncbi:glycerophosphoryl diester phosphodiesterase membrane domain-containing protein [Radiobacillus sp. PE A8.2]|uniref:glycerophosphoryl diester phosphodiesterase membrane domain-containing protein n=1 Tax=Radiobacillus sp. PE A8.2 TaxID=3380349 RepID=UPI00388DF0A8